MIVVILGVIVPEDPVTPEDPKVTPQNVTFVKTTTAPVTDKRYLLVASVDGKLFAGKTVQGTKKYDYLHCSPVTDNTGKITVSDDNLYFTFRAGSRWILHQRR